MGMLHIIEGASGAIFIVVVSWIYHLTHREKSDR